MEDRSHCLFIEVCGTLFNVHSGLTKPVSVLVTFHFQSGFHFAVLPHLFFLSSARKNKV